MLVMSVTNKRRGIESVGPIALVGSQTARVVGSGEVTTPFIQYTYWNLFDKTSFLDLTNNDLTVTHNGPEFEIGGVRAVDGKTTGKWYFEIDATSMQVGGSGVGLAPGGVPLVDISDADILLWEAGGVLVYDESVVANLGTLDGSVAGVAFDADAKLAWIRRNNEDWNANASADPATGTGGIDVSTIAGAELYPFVRLQSFDEPPVPVCTANFGDTTFAFTKPTGFSGWTGEGS